MKEKIIEVKGKEYKIIEVEEGSIYELKKKRCDGVFYKINRYNDKSLESAIENAIEYKI